MLAFSLRLPRAKAGGCHRQPLRSQRPAARGRGRLTVFSQALLEDFADNLDGRLMTVKSACVYAILVCTIFFKGEFAAAGTPPGAKSPAIPADTFCEVDAKTYIRDIPRTLYGTNIEWFNNGNG